MFGAYPIYGWAKEIGIDPEISPRVTSWNETLGNALSEIEGVEVHFITSTKTIRKTRTVQQANLEVTFFVSPPKMNMLSIFEYTRYNIQKMLNSYEPDIVHGIGTEHIWPYIALRSGYPFVVTVHGIMNEINKKVPPSLISRKRFFGFLERQVLRQTEHLITINPYVKDSLGKYTSAKMYSVENPISQLFFQADAAPDSSEKVLYVGTIEPRKDQITLIRAFAQVLEALNTSGGLELILVGPANDTEYGRLVRNEIKDRGVKERVQFKGFSLPDRLARLYASAGLLVLSSIEETAPMCIAEAMGCGLPVVSTRVGGVEHMVEEGETGYTVPPRDPDALAKAMLHLLKSPERRRDMGLRAKEVAKQRFHPDLIARKTIEVYQKVLEAGVRRYGQGC